VERVATSFGGGRTSVVETGMVSVDGDIVADATSTGVGVSDNAARGDAEEETAGEQANRNRVRKRSVQDNLFICA